MSDDKYFQAVMKYNEAADKIHYLLDQIELYSRETDALRAGDVALADDLKAKRWNKTLSPFLTDSRQEPNEP